MRAITLVLALALTLAASEKKTPEGVPEGATQSDAQTYRHTDSKGKAWIYRRTPFGWAKLEDKPDTRESKEKPVEIKAVEDGDVVRFEKPGPFGVYKWQRKKSELSAEEKAALERAQKK